MHISRDDALQERESYGVSRRSLRDRQSFLQQSSDAEPTLPSIQLTVEQAEWIMRFTLNGQTRLPEASRGREVAIQIARLNRHVVDITDPATASVAAQVKRWYSTMDASVSWYTLQESCHNRKNGVCITASGKPPVQGVTVACPRSVPLGTRVSIKGLGEYTCEDRTAKWVEKKHGPTFDIFMNDQKAALEFGRQTLEVTIAYEKK